MKHFTFLVLVCMLCFPQSKAYSQPISENAHWFTHFQIGAPPTESYTYYKTGGDTLINSTNYIKLWSAEVHMGGPGNTYLLTPMSCFAAFRNDPSDKAYIIPNGETIERLWYDFNLTVGDTLPLNPEWYSTTLSYGGNTNIIVSGIDSVDYCGVYYKRWHFTPPMSPDLVYNIGFTGDLLNYNWNYFEALMTLDTWSPDSTSNGCFLLFNYLSAENRNGLTSRLSVFPNPACDLVNLSIPSPQKNSSISVFNSVGETVLKTNFQKGESAVSIDVRALPAGLYLIKTGNYTGRFVKQ